MSVAIGMSRIVGSSCGWVGDSTAVDDVPSGIGHAVVCHMTNQRQREPQDWKTGDEPMTDAQASYLRTLCQEAGEPFDDNLTKAQASERIDALRARSPRLNESEADSTPPHPSQAEGGGESAPRPPRPSQAEGERRP